ncbi:MAG: hypothetical protein JSS75_07090 [Bacteroidetes bacterium]|nr:hypothetical protein [Bacteroidota bacterium]
MTISNPIHLVKRGISGTTNGSTALGTLDQDCVLKSVTVLSDTATSPNGDMLFRIQADSKNYASGTIPFTAADQRYSNLDNPDNPVIYLVNGTGVIEAGKEVEAVVVSPDSGTALDITVIVELLPIA